MSDSVVPEIDSRSRRKLSAWGCLGVVGIGLLVLCGGLFSTVFVVHQGNKARLASTLAELKASGAPIDAAGLAKLHAIPADANDLSDRYLAVLEHYRGPQPQGAFSTLPFVGTNGGSMPPRDQPWNELELAEGYLAARPWMAELDDLGATDGAVAMPLQFDAGFSMLLVHAQHVRDVGRDLQLRFHVHMRHNDRPAALRNIVATAGSTRAVERDPLLISQLVRVAVDSMAVEQTREFLRNGAATPEDVAALRRAFAGGYQEGLTRAMEGERGAAYVSLSTMNLDELQSVSGPGGKAPPSPLARMGKISDLMPADSEHLLRFQTKMIEATKEPTFHEALAEIGKLEQQLKAEIANNSSLPWNRKVLTPLLMPAIDAASRALGRGEAMRRTLRAQLDLQDHLASLPESDRTTAAVKAFLDAHLTRAEYADPFNGKPLLYKTTREGVTIYSTGENAVDDAGDVDMSNRRAPDYGVKIERALIDVAPGDSK